MKISEAKQVLSELTKNQRSNIRIEFLNHGDLEGAINRVLTEDFNIVFLEGWTEEMAIKSLGEVLSEDLMELAEHSALVTYFDTEAFGRDLILGGDYTIIKYKNQYYGVSNH